MPADRTPKPNNKANFRQAVYTTVRLTESGSGEEESPRLINPGTVDMNLIRLEDFVNQCSRLREDFFTRRYPHPFLVQENFLLDKSSAAAYHTTLENSNNNAATIDLKDCAIYLIRKKSQLFPNMISIGRTRNTDVWIDSSKISKFHAYFAQKGENWYIVDSGSTNGTSLENERLEANKLNPLTGNARISFGSSIHFIFKDGPGMFKFVKLLSQRWNHD